MSQKSTQDKIIHILKKKGGLSVHDLSKFLKISRQAVHKQLKLLLQNGLLDKKGIPPQVLYFLRPQESRIAESFHMFATLIPAYTENVKKHDTFWKLPEQHTIDLHFLLTSAALYSSKIEGNTLDLNSYINKAEIPKAKKREKREIDDLKNAYAFARGHALTEKNFLLAHKMLSGSFLAKNARGKYRADKVGVFGSAGLEYMAPEAPLVPSEMSELFSYIAKLLRQDMSKEEVYLWSLYIHIMIALIHPFADGNGRIARLVEKWFLAEKLQSKYWYIQSERFYWEYLQKYYKAISLGINYWELDFKKFKNFIKLHLF